ncbi:MAG: hypothetical protein HYS81_01900 [Candidatus Aenigmatarchaeota archaeon]|nr:MAG: hypothetical protein HYS81_01900 [Candidatus Aenigmarchaeota archaeon]
MTQLISYRGLMRLYELWRGGSSMPPGWRESVRRYVVHKRCRVLIDSDGVSQLAQAEQMAKMMFGGADAQMPV